MGEGRAIDYFVAAVQVELLSMTLAILLSWNIWKEMVVKQGPIEAVGFSACEWQANLFSLLHDTLPTGPVYTSAESQTCGTNDV